MLIDITLKITPKMALDARVMRKRRWLAIWEPILM